MKKLFLITLISAVLTAAVFAEPKTYAIDLGDSNIKKIEIVKNPYGVNHQCKALASSLVRQVCNGILDVP